MKLTAGSAPESRTGRHSCNQTPDLSRRSLRCRWRRISLIGSCGSSPRSLKEEKRFNQSNKGKFSREVFAVIQWLTLKLWVHRHDVAHQQGVELFVHRRVQICKKTHFGRTSLNMTHLQDTSLNRLQEIFCFELRGDTSKHLCHIRIFPAFFMMTISSYFPLEIGQYSLMIITQTKTDILHQTVDNPLFSCNE